MAINDIKILKGKHGAERYRTESAAATIKPGDVVKRGGTGGNFATVVLNGDPEITCDILLGVTYTEGSETSTANGVIDVELIGHGTVLEGKAATTANINTDAKLLLLLNDYVAFDRSVEGLTGTLTIDEDEGDDPNVHGLNIVGGDIVAGTLRVIVHTNVTLYGSRVGEQNNETTP